MNIGVALHAERPDALRELMTFGSGIRLVRYRLAATRTVFQPVSENPKLRFSQIEINRGRDRVIS
jgi:hypothetical protein